MPVSFPQRHKKIWMFLSIHVAKILIIQMSSLSPLTFLTLHISTRWQFEKIPLESDF